MSPSESLATPGIEPQRLPRRALFSDAASLLLRAAAPELRFVFLTGSRDLISERVSGRRGHFMPESLLDSQLGTLEDPSPDEHAWIFDIKESAQDIVTDIVAREAV